MPGGSNACLFFHPDDGIRGDVDFSGAAVAGTASEWTGKGNEAFAAKKYEEAVVFYSNAIQADRQCTQALYNRGLAYYRIGGMHQAWDDLVRLIETDPQSHKAFNLLGLVELKQGLYDSAFGRFRRASELQEKSKYCFNAGLAAFKAGFYDVAIKYGRDALVIDPENGRALKLITLSKRAQERIEETAIERAAEEQRRAEEAARMAAARRQCSVSTRRSTSAGQRRIVRRKG